MIELDKIYNEDCEEGLKKIEDNSIDLVVTSPPYDNMRTYNGIIDEWNFDKSKNVAKEIFRVLKHGGVCVWVVGDETVNGSESLSSFRQAIMFTEIGFNLHDTMIYYKDNPCPVGGKNRYIQSFEYMFVFSKGIPKTFNPLTEKRRNKHKDKRTERVKVFQRNPDGTFSKKYKKINQSDPKRRNVWCYSFGDSSHTGHPAVFPIKLVYDHIFSWSNVGDIVLDPFIGSGTTAIACINEKRHFIGFELNKEYYDKACKRIKDEQSQLTLDLF